MQLCYLNGGEVCPDLLRTKTNSFQHYLNWTLAVTDKTLKTILKSERRVRVIRIYKSNSALHHHQIWSTSHVNAPFPALLLVYVATLIVSDKNKNWLITASLFTDLRYYFTHGHRSDSMVKIYVRTQTLHSSSSTEQIINSLSTFLVEIRTL